MRRFVAALTAVSLLVSQAAWPSVSVTVNGNSYTIPQNNEKNWGTNVTNWIQAISANTLQPSGGAFSLLSDVDWGSSFGLKSVYFKSKSSNIAASGVLRLANGDAIGFRNSGNSADLLLKPDADGLLQYNSVDLVNLSTSQTLTNKTISGASNTLSNLSASNLTSGTCGIGVGCTGQTTAIAAFDALSPLTTKGDLVVYNGTHNVRIGSGSNGQVLTADSTQSSGVKWGSGIALTAPTVQKFTSGTGTYTTPAGVLYIRVRAVGGGGGGSGSSTAANAGAGGTGGTTTFGSSLLSAGGGNGGGAAGGAGAGGSGGASSLGTGPIGLALSGGGGQGISAASSAGGIAGGAGGSSALGGAGVAGLSGAAGSAGSTNTGGGGGGAGAPASGFTGSGGGSGGFVEALISAPSATYSYAVGAAGTAGTAGTSGFVGGAGGSGVIEVTEYYQ